MTDYFSILFKPASLPPCLFVRVSPKSPVLFSSLSLIAMKVEKQISCLRDSSPDASSHLSIEMTLRSLLSEAIRIGNTDSSNDPLWVRIANLRDLIESELEAQKNRPSIAPPNAYYVINQADDISDTRFSCSLSSSLNEMESDVEEPIDSLQVSGRLATHIDIEDATSPVLLPFQINSAKPFMSSSHAISFPSSTLSPPESKCNSHS